jgi:hypothetical protein
MQTPIPSSFRFFQKIKENEIYIAVSRENPGRFAHIPILLGSFHPYIL